MAVTVCVVLQVNTHTLVNTRLLVAKEHYAEILLLQMETSMLLNTQLLSRQAMVLIIIGFFIV